MIDTIFFFLRQMLIYGENTCVFLNKRLVVEDVDNVMLWVLAFLEGFFSSHRKVLSRPSYATMFELLV